MKESREVRGDGRGLGSELVSQIQRQGHSSDSGWGLLLLCSNNPRRVGCMLPNGRHAGALIPLMAEAGARPEGGGG